MAYRGRGGYPGLSFHKAGQLGTFQQQTGWARQTRNEEDYFNDDDEPVGVASEEGAPSDEEDDPLDAFMAGIESQVAKEKSKPPPEKKKAVRYDIEGEDDQESYFKAMANAPLVVAPGDEDIEVEYDSDGYPIVSEHSKVIDPLPPVDHSEIEYPSFTRNFYTEHKEISSLSPADIRDLKRKLGLKVTGFSPPRPCVSFAHFGFDDSLLNLIRRSEFSQPTAIQAQAIPVATSGRDIIGVAKTGSGKTAAFLWPLLVHAIDQPELKEGDGPIGLICAPTRELCQQIYHEARKFARAYNLSVTCVYGGGSKWEQSNAVKEGCEILVATPGRLIDLVKIKATNLRRVTYLVFDEADRMFDMGFEAQVRSIANHVRPDRQTMLFSATFRKKVERLCRDVLTDPVRIVVGDLGEANSDITQVVEVMRDERDKWVWLLQHLVEFCSDGSVLVFVTRKAQSEEVAASLRTEGHQVGLLHGDMGQGDRDSTIGAFKKREFQVLIATDVAARGLDIPAIKTVVNYTLSKDIDTHVHRIGRTGRAGQKGRAFTLITAKDSHFAGDLVRNLEVADQRVPEELMRIAMQNSRFRRSRQGYTGKGRGMAGKRPRPGLGSNTATISSGPMKAVAPPPSLGPMGSTVGPGSKRASVIKETFMSAYKSKFQQATGSLASTSTLSKPHPVATPTEPPQAKKKRKSRWD